MYTYNTLAQLSLTMVGDTRQPHQIISGYAASVSVHIIRMLCPGR